MDNRSLRAQALALATQLPIHEDDAKEVYRLLGELMKEWIYPSIASDDAK